MNAFYGTSQGQHPLRLSVFCPNSAQRPHPAVPAARESGGFFQSLSAPRSGEPGYPILRGAAEQFQLSVKEQADKWHAPIVEPPSGRRDEFVDPYFRGAGPDQVIVILKAREPARIMTAIGDKKLNRWHLQIADRWIVQYNFYISDQYWGRMFVRMCPYLPFSARVCLNQHHWLANRMREEGIDFQQCSNAFLRCGAPERLQQLADTP